MQRFGKNDFGQREFNVCNFKARLEMLRILSILQNNRGLWNTGRELHFPSWELLSYTCISCASRHVSSNPQHLSLSPSAPGFSLRFFLAYFAILPMNAQAHFAHRLPLAHLSSRPHSGDKIYWPVCFQSLPCPLWRTGSQALWVTEETARRFFLVFSVSSWVSSELKEVKHIHHTLKEIKAKKLMCLIKG